MVSRPVRLAVIDQRQLVSGVLALALADDPRLEIVAQINDPALALAVCRDRSPEVVMMDMSGGSVGSREVLASLIAELPGCPILIITSIDDDLQVAEALELGASGYLTAESTLRDVAAGVVAVAQGDTVLAQRQVTGVVRSLARGGIARRNWPESVVSLLTPRERQILRLLVLGQRTQAIADDLGITVQTTRTHIQNLLNKLGVPSRLAAAAFAVRHGVV